MLVELFIPFCEALVKENSELKVKIKSLEDKLAVSVYLSAFQFNSVLTPKSPIGKAFTYAQNQWSTLMALFQDGRLLIDNNHIENKIRPLALGRKNYLFAGSHEAGQRAAMVYSLLASCKEHGINPYEWLKDTLDCIPDTKLSQLHNLLPGPQWEPMGKDM